MIEELIDTNDYIVNCLHRLKNWGPPTWWCPLAAAQSVPPLNPPLVPIYLEVTPSIDVPHSLTKRGCHTAKVMVVNIDFLLKCSDCSISAFAADSL